MYLTNTLYYLYKREKRDTLIVGAKEIHRESGKPTWLIALDMIWSSFAYGAMFTEYRDLGFAYRNMANRKTYITTFFNFRLYDKYNSKNKRIMFHDKILFLRAFDNLIKRRWLDIKSCSDNEIDTFLKSFDSCVLKASYGDSGKEVELYQITDNCNIKSFKIYCAEHKFNLVEECLRNHSDLSVFNSSSLNTIRIVTVKHADKVDFLFAGLRVGAQGSFLDNISQGGAVARINLDTGLIDSNFYGKKSAHYLSDNLRKSPVGFPIPFWKEIRKLAIQAANVIEDVNIVAWDICVTEKGPEIIEGNESFGSVIMQLYNSPDEIGLKPKLKAILENQHGEK